MKTTLFQSRSLSVSVLSVVVFFAVFGQQNAWAKQRTRPKASEVTAQQIIAPSADEFVAAYDEKLSPESMGEIRAGFMDPSGFLLKFAVDVKTQIDGALTYVRSLVLNHDEYGRFKSNHTEQILPENLPREVSIASVNSGTGAIVTDREGKTTTVLTQASNGSFANIIMNTANNRDILQTMNIDLVLHNVNVAFGDVSQAARNFNAPAGLNQIAHMHSIGFGL